MDWSKAILNASNELMTECWGPLRKQSSNPPDILYHYTDSKGIHGILESKSLWASHAFFMNDPKELTHGMNIFRRLSRRSKTFDDRRTSGFSRDLHFQP